MQYAYIYIFQKSAYVHIYFEERKNRQLFVDQFYPYTDHLVHEFDLRSPISCKKIFYIRAILTFQRFYKIMETQCVFIVRTCVRTYCTCVNCIYSVHIYNFRESAYIAYIYNIFLHMGQRSFSDGFSVGFRAKIFRAGGRARKSAKPGRGEARKCSVHGHWPSASRPSQAI